MPKLGKYVVGRLSSSQKALFPSKTNFWEENGRVKAPYRSMLIGRKITPGQHSNIPYKSKFYTQPKWFDDRRMIQMPSSFSGKYAGKGTNGRSGVWTRRSWAATKGGSANVIQLKNFDEMYLQMAMAAHLLRIETEHWRFVLAQHALAVFQKSFEIKRFNSAGAPKWRVNTRWTLRKRKWKKTWPGAGKLMQETNALYKSMTVETKNGMTAVVTKPIGGVCYAGVHNNPEPGMTYGDGFGGKYSPPKPVTQRQFMGHSTEIDSFIVQYEKSYMFDAVFRKP